MPLSFAPISEYKVGDILDMDVKFKNEKTGRMKTGKIKAINKSAALVVDGQNVGRWIAWHGVHKKI